MRRCWSSACARFDQQRDCCGLSLESAAAAPVWALGKAVEVVDPLSTKRAEKAIEIERGRFPAAGAVTDIGQVEADLRAGCCVADENLRGNARPRRSLSRDRHVLVFAQLGGEE